MSAIFQNLNGSWNPPAGFKFTKLTAAGSFLCVEFRKIVDDGYEVETVFTNDHGREVARVKEHFDAPMPEPVKLPTPKPVLKLGLWQKIQLWWEFNFGDLEKPCSK